MRASYHPIEDGLWKDEKFDSDVIRGLTEASFCERGFFAYLCSNDHQRPSGIYRVTDGELAAGSRLPIEEAQGYLTSLESRGLIVRDGAWIFVPGYFKRQSKNPNLLDAVESQVKSCSSVKILDSFKGAYPLCIDYLPNHFTTVEQPLGNGGTTIQSNAEQSNAEQSNNTSPREDLLSNLPATVTIQKTWPSPHALVEKYNRESPDECPAVNELSPGRKMKARKYLDMFPKEEFWTRVFQQIHQSKFLRGLKNTDAHEGFVASLDWLLTKGKDGTENVVKTVDGRYRDGKR